MKDTGEWIDFTHEIANSLENRASLKLNSDMEKAQAEYKGYVQACEDFAKAMREQIGNGV
jgi:hypothetical protein